MEIIKTSLEGVLLVKPRVFGDNRGHFFEYYNENNYNFLSNGESFVQENQSLSHKDVVRGLHLQLAPHSQGKLVRVVTGAVLDVVVDTRKNSSTFGKHLTLELNDENNYLLFIPGGCLHGFTTLKNNTIFAYKCTNFYNKDSEVTVMWNDSELAIDWQCNNPIISDKDKFGIPFIDFINKYL